jgi:uncharacterized OB-fold protein
MGVKSSPVKIWREAKARYQPLGKSGRLVSFTKVWQGPAGFETNSPYWVGMVRLKGNQKVIGQIIRQREEKPKMGVKVKGVLRILNKGKEADVIEYGVKFKVFDG